MATKAQERKALEQIKKILAGLGDESYVAQAMDGMIEDAEQNIENDFWNSWKDRCEYKDAEYNKLEKKLEEANARAEEAERRQKVAEELLKGKSEEADRWFSRYNEEHNKNEMAERKAQNGTEELQRRVEAQELEILKLKAKLYDMMVGA